MSYKLIHHLNVACFLRYFWGIFALTWQCRETGNWGERLGEWHTVQISTVGTWTGDHWEHGTCSESLNHRTSHSCCLCSGKGLEEKRGSKVKGWGYITWGGVVNQWWSSCSALWFTVCWLLTSHCSDHCTVSVFVSVSGQEALCLPHHRDLWNGHHQLHGSSVQTDGLLCPRDEGGGETWGEGGRLRRGQRNWHHR